MADLQPLMVTAEQAQRLGKMLRRLENVRGQGVRVSDDGITIDPPPPAPPGTPPLPPRAQFCLVQQNGGAAGSDSTTCDFTYDVFARSDTGFAHKLNTNPVTPLNVRKDNVEYDAAVTGIYQYFGADDFDLFLCDESESTEDCAA